MDNFLEQYSRMNETLKNLSDDSLQDIAQKVKDEQYNRILARMKKGEFPDLNEQERLLVKEGSRFNAMKQYRERTNLPIPICSIIVK